MWGRSFGWSGFALLALLAMPYLRAQTPSREQFDDLSRRAQAALGAHPDEAIQLYKQALAIRPDWAEGWLYMGGAFYQLQRYAEAVDALHKGLDLAPVFANGWALLGLSESQLEDEEQALADIRKGEQMGLANNIQFETAVRVRAAQLLIRSSAFDEALAQLQPLTRHPSVPPVVEEEMGLCALASPDDLGQLSPPRRAVVDLAGHAAWSFATQRLDAATAAYKQLVAQYPKEPGVHYAYGLFLMETDTRAALAEFQQEVQNNPTHWPAMLVLASLQIRQGAPEKAMETVRKGMKDVPTRYRWLCHMNLGRADLDSDNATAAVTELEAALRQMPSNPSVHYYLAEAYRNAGRKADADKEKTEFERLKAQHDPLGVPALHSFGVTEK